MGLFTAEPPGRAARLALLDTPLPLGFEYWDASARKFVQVYGPRTERTLELFEQTLLMRPLYFHSFRCGLVRGASRAALGIQMRSAH